ncbi:MAG TPA: PAS domain-containing protein [Burkholderiales bacterium]|nr:PAS domain-containing protein [Burkholderiales bacterium]
MARCRFSHPTSIRPRSRSRERRSNPANIAAHISPERLRKFFTVPNNDHYQVNTQVRETAMFAVQNLILDPPFSKLDLIVCRNLLIYLEPETQKKLISLFHFSLLESGVLFLGSAETIGTQDDSFKPIAKRWRIFRRIGPTRHDRVDFPLTSGEGAPHGEQGAKPPQPFGAKIAALAQTQLLERFAPASVLIDQKCNILYYWGPTRDYLIQSPGTPSADLLTTAREGLRAHLRSAVHRAIRDERPVVLEEVRVKRNDGYHSVTITVNPVRAKDFDKLLLVTFEDRKTEEVKRKDDAASDESLVQQLEAELKVSEDDLQSNIEQLESSNEELKAATEEVTSINEELQSTNEELETSKEELQSLNEELSTVNNQLQGQLEEMENVNNDLKNLLTSTDVATIFLDNTFHIKRFTPAMTKLLPLVAGDVGRLLSDFSQKFTDRDLLVDAQSVLDTLTPRSAEVKTDDGHWYFRRVLPYRTSDNRISGVVITFTDITQLKAEHERANDAMERLTVANQDLEERVAERTAAVEHSADQLRALTSELALTEAHERQKLSVDLHEGLAQGLTLAIVKLTSLSEDLQDEVGKKQVHAIGKLLSEANHLVRSHIFSLSPPVLQDFGLVHALSWLADDLAQTHGLKVKIRHKGETRLADERIERNRNNPANRFPVPGSQSHRAFHFFRQALRAGNAGSRRFRLRAQGRSGRGAVPRGQRGGAQPAVLEPGRRRHRGRELYRAHLSGRALRGCRADPTRARSHSIAFRR